MSSFSGQGFLFQKYFWRKESILKARFSPIGKMFNWLSLGPSLAWQTSCLIATGSSRFQACNLCRELRCSVMRKEEVIPPQPIVATYQNNLRLGNDWRVSVLIRLQVDLQCPVGYKFTIFKHLAGRVTSLIYTQLHLLPWIISPASRVKWGMMGGSVLGWDVIDQKCGSFTKSLQPSDSTRSSVEILEVHEYRAWKYEHISQTKQ